MTILDISDPDDPRIPIFYDLYQRVFVLEEEREPIDGFRTILGLNGQAGVQEAFGPLQEQVAVAFHPETGSAIGLANYILYAYPGAAGRFGGSCQLNFLCVDENHRGNGLAGRLLDHVDRRLAAFVTDKTRASDALTFITIEQNNPARMAPEQLSADLDAAGIDPARRRRWWAKKGYRRLDFPYQQPPLSPDVEPCTYLDYFARIPGDAGQCLAGLPAATLAEHLRRFFFVSVGKFAVDMAANPEWLKQSHDLANQSEIAFDAGP